MGRLTERNEYGTARFKDIPQVGTQDMINKLCELEEAEEQGRLVVLPCKYGDEIYHIFGGAIVSATVRRIILSETDCYMIEVIGGRCFYNDKLNIEWFVTHEAAEVALKKGAVQE